MIYSTGIPMFTLQEVLRNRENSAGSYEISCVPLQVQSLRHELRIAGQLGKARPVSAHINQDVSVPIMLSRREIAAGPRLSHDCSYQRSEFLLPVRGMPLHMQRSLHFGQVFIRS